MSDQILLALFIFPKSGFDMGLPLCYIYYAEAGFGICPCTI